MKAAFRALPGWPEDPLPIEYDEEDDVSALAISGLLLLFACRFWSPFGRRGATVIIGVW